MTDPFAVAEYFGILKGCLDELQLHNKPQQFRTWMKPACVLTHQKQRLLVGRIHHQVDQPNIIPPF